jgi:hypothetical protein
LTDIRDNLHAKIIRLLPLRRLKESPMSLKLLAGLFTLTLTAGFAMPAGAQEVLPFPPKESGSTAGRTMLESIYSPLPTVSHLPKDAPNILIVLIDDVGPAQTDTYGGEIHTPTLSKIANEGVSYNRFHTTAMCSPTRAALFTGRNHHRVANGQIGELANANWNCGGSGDFHHDTAFQKRGGPLLRKEKARGWQLGYLSQRISRFSTCLTER